jgi:multidrug efflux pump
MAPGANALDTAKAVKERMAELAKYFPKGISWIMPYDTSRFVDISIREVLKTLAEAMALVFLVMYVFLGNLRATFIPTIVVPVAAGRWPGRPLSARLFGQRADPVRHGAGDRHRRRRRHRGRRERRAHHERGEPGSPRDATRKAMDQIVGAIIAITVVLSAVFVPMAFFGGSTGAIYRQFAVTLVLTMGFSALAGAVPDAGPVRHLAQAQAGQR